MLKKEVKIPPEIPQTPPTQEKEAQEIKDPTLKAEEEFVKNKDINEMAERIHTSKVLNNSYFSGNNVDTDFSSSSPMTVSPVVAD